MGVTFVRGEAVGFEAEEMSIGYKAGLGDSCQRLKRVQVRYLMSVLSAQSNCYDYRSLELYCYRFVYLTVRLER